MWEALLHGLMVTALGSITASLPFVVPPLRRLLVRQARLDKIVGEGELAKRLDAGVTNLIVSTIEDLQKRAGFKDLDTETIVNHTQPKVQRNFPETLHELKLQPPAQRDYIKARIPRANSVTPPDHR